MEEDHNRLPNWLSVPYSRVAGEATTERWALALDAAEAAIEYLLFQCLAVAFEPVEVPRVLSASSQAQLARNLGDKVAFGTKVGSLRTLAKDLSEPLTERLGFNAGKRMSPGHAGFDLWRALTKSNALSCGFFDVFNALVEARNGNVHGRPLSDPEKRTMVPLVRAYLWSLPDDVDSLVDMPVTSVKGVKRVKVGNIAKLRVTLRPLRGAVFSDLMPIDRPQNEDWAENSLVVMSVDDPTSRISVPSWLAILDEDRGEDTLWLFQGRDEKSLHFRTCRTGGNRDKQVPDLYTDLEQQAPFLLAVRLPDSDASLANSAIALERFTRRVRQYINNDGRLDDQERAFLRDLAEDLDLPSDDSERIVSELEAELAVLSVPGAQIEPSALELNADAGTTEPTAEDPDASSAKGPRYQAFFQRLIEKAVRLGLPPEGTPGPRNWYSRTLGLRGLSCGVVFNRGDRIKAELYIDNGDGQWNLLVLQTLVGQREAIEAELDGAVTWEDLPGKRACRVGLSRDGSIDDPADRLDELCEWGAGQLVRFLEVFGRRLPALRGLQHQAEGVETPPAHSEPTAALASASTGHGRRVWLIAAGAGGAEWNSWLMEGSMGIDFGSVDRVGDISSVASRAEIHSRLVPPDSQQQLGNDSLALWQFGREMQVGDLVYAKAGRSNLLGRGEVVSEYRFCPAEPYPHQRQVRWERLGIKLVDHTLALKTLTEITGNGALLREVVQRSGTTLPPASSPTADGTVSRGLGPVLK